MVLESIDMFFQSGSSDKEYHIQINQQNDHLYNVEAQWGRRGGALNSAVKTITNNLTDARKVFNKIKGEKLGKGYQAQGGVVADPVTTPVDTIQESVANPGRRRIMWRDDILPDPVTGPNALNGLYHEEQQPALAPEPAVLPNGRIQTDIHPQLLNEILDPAGCEMYLDSDYWAMQEKMNGKHVTVRWDATTRIISTTNKKGEQIISSPSFIEALRPFLVGRSSMLIDGEQIGDKFYTYDILEYAGNDLRVLTYSERYSILTRQFSASLVGIAKVPLYTGADKRLMFDEFKTQNKEGVVFKRLASIFTAGKAHADMFKWKWYSELSARACEGRAGKNSIGLELLDENGVWNFMGYCTVAPSRMPIPMGSVCEIRYLYVAGIGGHLYQPSFKEIRDDVDLSECTMAQVKYTAQI